MRITSISSSIASVVSRVIGFVAAGSAVRTFLHHTHLREQMLMDLGYWLEPCQPGFPCGDQYGLQRGNPMTGNKPGVLRLVGIATLAFRSALLAEAPARLAVARANRRG